MNETKVIALFKKHQPATAEDAFELVRGKMTRTALRPIFRKFHASLVSTKQSSKSEETVALLQKQIVEMQGVKDNINVFPIAPKAKSKGETEAVVVAVASDWHVEEEVKKEWVNDTNEYNLEISKKRSEQFFQSVLRLTQIVGRDVKVNTMVLALLGDFITNDIHPEMMEVNLLLPNQAAQRVQSYLASGIKFLLENTDLDFIIPCSTGNHGRVTRLPYKSTEHGHSWEHLVYNNLKWYFESEPRIKFIVNDSYHTIIDVLGFKMRLHHGHEMKYNGGMGGMYIPVNKKIAQWNKAITVNLDVFGHFHSLKHGGNFIANGSMIGYNPYAMRGGFDFEKPKQAFFVIDEKRGLTWFAPILFTV